MYKLFTDKTELFECSISLKGASLKKSKARLVVETPEYSLLFNGNISNSGKCKIPIKYPYRQEMIIKYYTINYIII